MKKDDIKKASKILDMINKIDKLIVEIDLSLQKICNENDHGSILGDLDDIGYNISISEHSDGSGCRINMSGLYVGVEIFEAARTVLITKKDKLIQYGKSIGIDFK